MNTATTQVTTAVREQAEGSQADPLGHGEHQEGHDPGRLLHPEQAAGGRQVRLAVENMNKIASQVGIATKEQAEGSRQIVHAVEKMNDMTQQVSHATAEQKKGGELVVKAMENISEIARDNLATVRGDVEGHRQPGPAGREPGQAHLGLPAAVSQSSRER